MTISPLPELPDEATERVPALLEFNGLTIADGFDGAGNALANDQFLADTAARAAATVYAQDTRPLAGVLV